MVLGYSKPLYLLAFDHRGSFGRDLCSASHPIPDSGMIAGTIGRSEAVDQIAARYLETVSEFTG